MDFNWRDTDAEHQPDRRHRVHSRWHVCDDLRNGRLQAVLPDHPIATTGIYAVMPQRRLVPPRVRAFVDFFAERFGDNPPWERALAK